MKQDFRSYALVKALALVLTIACAVGSCFGFIYSAYHWDSFFDGDDSSTVLMDRVLTDRLNQLTGVLRLYDTARRGEKLSYLQQTQYTAMLAALSPENTNFRYILRDDDTGEILLSSAGEGSLAHVSRSYATSRRVLGGTYSYNDWWYDDERDMTFFYYDGELVAALEGPHTEGDYAVVSTPDHSYAIEYGVDDRLMVQDEFVTAYTTFRQGDSRAPSFTAGLILAALGGTVFLMCCAGRRRGTDAFTLNWTDRIPYDLYLFAVGFAFCMTASLGIEYILRSYWYYGDQGDWILINCIGALLLAGAGILLEAGLMSTATRIKTHTLLKNTVIWRCCAWGRRLLGWLWGGCKAAARSLGEIVGALPLTGRVMGFSCLYLFISAVLAAGLFTSYHAQGFCFLCLLLLNVVVLGLICRWTLQWHKVSAGTEAIVSGRPDTVIDTAQMQWFPSLRTHAERLNDLGSAINTAVDERMKSERMKAELITNVSHDLKTPLTSIINYVDLLKKEDVQEEKAREYIEVLDRKSQRLKKLTEDLVEASKASTGTVAVNPERLGVVQLVDQAIGEYSEKLSAAQLTLLPAFPPEEHYVMADGRHFWRVLDNLLGNCVKYALPGTRVYLDMTVWDGWVTLSLKNISASQLNIPAEQLMERFVRGDESRTTEGSGLGLSIARSLTELQGGRFRLDVDGDLFKAVVSFPECR